MEDTSQTPRMASISQLPDSVDWWCAWCGDNLPDRKHLREGASGYCSYQCKRDCHSDLIQRAAPITHGANRAIGALVEFVAREFGLPPSAIYSPARAKRVAAPRHLVCWIARRKHAKSLAVIGRALGGRHHTTVGHSCALVDVKRSTYPTFRARADDLLARAP